MLVLNYLMYYFVFIVNIWIRLMKCKLNSNEYVVIVKNVFIYNIL